MSYSGAAAIAWAKTQVGFHEGPNNRNPYSQWQYGNPFNPWCASFQCMANYAGGYRFPTNCTYGEKGEAYTPTEAQRAKEQGLWRPRDWRALPGDAVLFDWRNDGLIDHVELVEYDDGRILLTIGGNTSDAVMHRTRTRDNVAGFWGLSQDKSQAKPTIDPAVLAALARIAKWRKSITYEKPIVFRETSWRVSILADLFIAEGLLVRKTNTFNKAVRDANVHMKKIAQAKGIGTIDNIIGVTFGPPAADALLELLAA